MNCSVARSFELGAATNVWSTSRFKLGNKPTLAVGVQNGVVLLSDISTNASELADLTPLANLPSDGSIDVVSVAAFNRLHDGVPILAVAVISVATLSPKLLIYGAACKPTDSTLDAWRQSCQEIELSFTPFVLKHTHIAYSALSGMKVDRSSTAAHALQRASALGRDMLLLAGSDRCVHVFKQIDESGTFAVVPHSRVGHPFPELRNLPSCVLSLDVQYLPRTKTRVVCVGCQNGLVFFASTDLSQPRADARIERHQVDGPVSSVCLFGPTLQSVVSTPPELPASGNKVNPVAVLHERSFRHLSKPIERSGYAGIGNYEQFLPSALTTSLIQPEHVHLLVSGATGHGMWLHRVDNHRQNMAGDSSCERARSWDFEWWLPASDEFDAVLCGRVVYEHKQPVLMLGTWAQQLLVYAASSHDVPADPNRDPDDLRPQVSFDLIQTRAFAHPIHAVESMDFCGDGIENLVVVSKFGVHVLQFDHAPIHARLTETLDLLEEIKLLEQTRSNLLAAAKSSKTTPTVGVDNRTEPTSESV